MSQYFSGKRVAAEEDAAEGVDGSDDVAVVESDSELPSTVFLEDLETYKAYLFVCFRWVATCMSDRSVLVIREPPVELMMVIYMIQLSQLVMMDCILFRA